MIVLPKPTNQTAKATKDRRGRKGAPIVSLVVASGLILACGIFVIARRNPGQTPDDEPVSTESQTVFIPSESEEPSDTPPIIIFDNISVGTQSSIVAKTQAVKVRGVYIDAWTASASDEIEWLIGICDTSAINAIVIDVKEDNGYITFLSDNEKLAEVCIDVISDIELLMSLLNKHDIYTIARLVCFKDPIRARLDPELAVMDKNGATWADSSGVAWLNPYNTDSWEYIATVAKEAAKVGFDEIQLDYVRFPADGNLGQIDYGGGAESKTKAEIIREFLEYIRAELESTSARLSADVFGIIAVSRGDFEGIGQDLELMWDVVDAVSPMIYPSHFANIRSNGVGQMINGVLFERPDLNPYGVVYNIMEMTRNRLPEDGDHAAVRPYLQAFTASYLGSGFYQVYGANEILEQINAVYDAGFEEWILWNHSGRYEIYESVGVMLREEVVEEEATR